jgi:beta-lactamase class A
MTSFRLTPVLVVTLAGLGVTPLAPTAASQLSARHGSTVVAAASVRVVRHHRRTLRDRLESYAETRQGSVSVAVFDSVARRMTVLHRRDRMVTASIVKVDILQTLLHQYAGQLPEALRDQAQRMIEISDNDAASDLWNRVGGSSGVRRYNSRLGLRQTRPHDGGQWGLTRTSAADQVTLVRTLLRRTPLLSPASQQFARHLMRHTAREQRWGVSAGPSAQAVVGLKDGWLPVAADDDRWAINSIGWVRDGRRKYEIAILTAHQPSEDYGIDTVEGLSRIVWAHMARHRQHRKQKA